MKIWQWLVFVVISYIAFLLMYIPAGLVASQVAQQTNNQVQLMQVSGTLFNGRAGAVEANGFRINNVDWTLSPWHLLTLTAQIDLKGGAIRDSEQIYVEGNANLNLLSMQDFSVQDARLFVPAKAVLSQFKLPVAVTANGRFRLDIEQLDMSPNCTNLTGEGAWLNAEVDTPQQAVNLGNFIADLACENGDLTVNVNDGNNLQLSADLVVTSEGSYSVTGQFRPNPDLPPIITQAADSFFQRDAQGFYQIRL